jgi:hypothetical protein
VTDPATPDRGASEQPTLRDLSALAMAGDHGAFEQLHRRVGAGPGGLDNGAGEAIRESRVVSGGGGGGGLNGLAPALAPDHAGRLP